MRIPTADLDFLERERERGGGGGERERERERGIERGGLRDGLRERGD